MFRATAFLFLATLCVGLVSCAHYRLGTGNEPAFATLHVAVVKTDILVPQAQAIITTQVRNAFLKDGRIKLVDTPESADATLTLTLADYRREIAVVRPDDTGLARRFEITLEAHADLRDNRSLKMIFAGRPLVARRGVFADSGQIQAEYQNIPLLAAQLADDAVRAVLNTW